LDIESVNLGEMMFEGAEGNVHKLSTNGNKNSNSKRKLASSLSPRKWLL